MRAETCVQLPDHISLCLQSKLWCDSGNLPPAMRPRPRARSQRMLGSWLNHPLALDCFLSRWGYAVIKIDSIWNGSLIGTLDFSSKYTVHSSTFIYYNWYKNNHQVKYAILFLYVQAAITKVPQTGVRISNRNLFLAVLEAGKLMIKEPADSVSGEGILPRS